MTQPSVIVVGPAGCGKTRHAEALRRHFKLERVIDTGADLAKPHYRVPNNGVLVLATPDVTLFYRKGVRKVTFEQAAKEAGL